MDFIDELVKRISSKGDVGTALLGFVAGYLLGLRFAITNLAPGTAGALGLIAAVGFKNVIEAIWDRSRLRRTQRKQLESALSLIAEDTTDWRVEEAKLRRDHKLLVGGLVSDLVFEMSITEFAGAYRARGQRLPAVEVERVGEK